MKWLIITLVLIVGLIMVVFTLSVGSAWAAPFLVCDPQPKFNNDSGVEHYLVIIDGSVYEDAVQTTEDLGNDTVRLRFNLADINPGAHVVEVRAVNIWGESTPVPFEFTKGSPVSPINIGLSQ